MNRLHRSLSPLILVLSLAAVGVMQPAPSQAQADAKIYTFGVMVPDSGPAADMGESYHRGIGLAIDDINDKGGVDGWKLKAIFLDHKGSALGGAQAMNQLVNLDKVPFVVTTFTGVTLAAQPIAQQNGVVLMNVGGTSNNLLNKPWLYNNQVMGEALNLPLARYAYDKGTRSAALLTSEDAYGKDAGVAFTEAFARLGGKVVASETFPISSTDFTAQLTKIRASNPDVLYVVSVGSTEGLILKQARALDIKASMLGPLIAPEAIAVGGRASEGVVSSAMAVDPATKDPAARAFFTEFRAKYHIVPTFGSGTAYEAVRYLGTLIHEVVRSGGDPRNGATLVKAIEAHPTYQNYLSGGPVRLQSDHGSVRGLILQQVKDGQFVLLKTIQPPK